MESEEIDALISDLDKRVERLKAMYEQYFMGVEKLEPTILRKDVDRRFWTLRKIQVRNTALRFRLNTVTQRYNTYQQYWRRILREIETGTYKRHLQKANKRFGKNAEAIAKKGHFDQEEDRKRQQEQKEREDRARRALEEVPDLDSFDIDVSFDLDDDSGFGPEPVSSIDLDAAFDISRPAQELRAPEPTRPARSHRGLSHLDDAFEEDDDDITQPHQIPSFLQEQQRPTPPRPPKHIPRPPARTQPALRPGGPRAMPRPGHVARSEQAQHPQRPTPQRAQDATRKQTHQRPPSPPMARPGSARLQRPQDVRGPQRPPANQERGEAQGHQRSRHSSPPGVPVRKTTGARPHDAPRRTNGSARTRPQRTAPARSEASAKQAAARKPVAAQDGLAPDRVREIYEKFVTTKRQCHESTSSVTERSLAASLNKSAEKLRKKHGRDVDFEVVVHNGKAVIKPKLKKK